ncbi:MAG: acyl-CoA dehydrogenase family protein, partial [Acidimicrobiales bacterium]
ALVATVEPGSGWRGLRMLMVDALESPGVSVLREERKMGLRGSSLAALAFENVEVPAENMIGGDTGLRAAQRLLDFARPNVAGMACGLAAAAMEYALSYTLERHAFGQRVFDFQGVSFPIADMAIRIEAGRELAYKAAQAVDSGDPRASELASMAKVFCTDTAMAVTTDAVQCLGGHGYLKDHPVERMMRDAKVMQIYIGTNQIQRMLIAEALARRVRGSTRPGMGQGPHPPEEPGCRGPGGKKRTVGSDRGTPVDRPGQHRSRQGQVVGRLRGHGTGLGPGLAGRGGAVHQGRQVEDGRAQAGRPPRHRVADPRRRLHLGVDRPGRDGGQGPPRLGGGP